MFEHDSYSPRVVRGSVRCGRRYRSGQRQPTDACQAQLTPNGSVLNRGGDYRGGETVPIRHTPSLAHGVNRARATRARGVYQARLTVTGVFRAAQSHFGACVCRTPNRLGRRRRSARLRPTHDPAPPSSTQGLDIRFVSGPAMATLRAAACRMSSPWARNGGAVSRSENVNWSHVGTECDSGSDTA